MIDLTKRRQYTVNYRRRRWQKTNDGRWQKTGWATKEVDEVSFPPRPADNNDHVAGTANFAHNNAIAHAEVLLKVTQADASVPFTLVDWKTGNDIDSRTNKVIVPAEPVAAYDAPVGPGAFEESFPGLGSASTTSKKSAPAPLVQPTASTSESTAASATAPAVTRWGTAAQGATRSTPSAATSRSSASSGTGPSSGASSSGASSSTTGVRASVEVDTTLAAQLAVEDRGTPSSSTTTEAPASTKGTGGGKGKKTKPSKVSLQQFHAKK